MTESREVMLNNIKSLQAKSQNINKLEDKGSKAMVLQLGSHSIKMGFANERTPFCISPYIAYRHTQPAEYKQPQDQPFDQAFFKEQYLTTEEELKAQGVINVENRPFKGKPRSKQVINVDRIPNFNQHHTTLYGDEALRVEHDPNFDFRKILVHGSLNVSKEEEEADRISDLENLLVYLMKIRIKIPEKEWSSFTCVIVLPDIFVRRHVKMMLRSIFSRIGFRKVYLHLQSVMACFGSAVNSACVVDIGHEKISVCCVDEGVVLPKTLVRKNFGGKDISKVLARLFNDRISETGIQLHTNSQADIYHMDRIKEIACAIRQPEETSTRIYEINPIRKGLETAVQIPYNDSIVVASNSYFNEIWNAFDLPDLRDPFNPYSPFYDLYYDEEDFFEEFSGGGHYLELPAQVNLLSDSLVDPFIAQPLDEAVLASLLSIKDKDIRRKFSSNILVIGGGAHLSKLTEEIILRVNRRIQQLPDNEEKVELATDLPLREIPPIHASWLGGTALPKLDSLRDLWIERGKFLGCLAMDDEEEENVLDKKLFTRKEQSQQWGIRYLKEKVPFLW